MKNVVYLVVFLLISPFLSHAQTITTVAGCGIGNDSIPAHAELEGPVGIAFDGAGNSYIADASHYMVRKVSTSGVITTIAGTGLNGYSGDGGPATAATLGQVYSVAVDKAGNVFVADNSNNVIRKINTSGIITTVAGTGVAGYNGDSRLAVSAQLNSPIDIVLDTAGNVIFTDWLNNRVRKINTSGYISTIVGTGTVTGAGNHGPATASSIGRPFRVTMDKVGNLYVAEVIYQCICKVDTGGIITIIADTTGNYSIGPDGDGGSALTATMTSPCGLALDTAGHLFFSDIGNNRVRVINLRTGIISNYAGNGIPGYSGDGGSAVAAMLGTLEGLACDSAGNLFISDADNNRIRMVNTSGTISTFAGQSAHFEDGNAATSSEIGTPYNVAVDPAGNVHIADGANNRIREINVSTGVMTTSAGSGISGYQYSFSGDGGAALNANLSTPAAVAFDAAGNMYIADQYNSRIRKVNAASGVITTVAGKDSTGYNGDNIPATNAWLNYPTGVALDAAGNIYIADQSNSRIRKVDASGIITTVAGSFARAYAGDGGPATHASLNYPSDVAVDNAGNVYICDGNNSMIRVVDTAGIIHAVTLYGTPGYNGDGIAATGAQLNYPSGIKVDANGNIIIADGINQRIRVINKATGIISTVAGNGTNGFSGDGGAAVSAELNYPSGIALDNAGNLYIADGYNDRIRKVNISYLQASSVKPVNAALSVYPNPAHDVITINYSSPLTGADIISVYNAVGQEVLTSMLLTPRQIMDVSNLPPGVYIVQLSNKAGARLDARFVKE